MCGEQPSGPVICFRGHQHGPSDNLSVLRRDRRRRNNMAAVLAGGSARGGLSTRRSARRDRGDAWPAAATAGAARHCDAIHAVAHLARMPRRRLDRHQKARARPRPHGLGRHIGPRSHAPAFKTLASVGVVGARRRAFYRRSVVDGARRRINHRGHPCVTLPSPPRRPCCCRRASRCPRRRADPAAVALLQGCCMRGSLDRVVAPS